MKKWLQHLDIEVIEILKALRRNIYFSYFPSISLSISSIIGFLFYENAPCSGGKYLFERKFFFCL